jgi:hypothetical protein
MRLLAACRSTKHFDHKMLWMSGAILEYSDRLLVLLGHKRTNWCRIVWWDHASPRQAHKKDASRHI